MYIISHTSECCEKWEKKRYIITKLNTDDLIRGRGVWNTGRLIIGIQTLFNI